VSSASDLLKYIEIGQEAQKFTSYIRKDEPTHTILTITLHQMIVSTSPEGREKVNFRVSRMTLADITGTSGAGDRTESKKPTTKSASALGWTIYGLCKQAELYVQLLLCVLLFSPLSRVFASIGARLRPDGVFTLP
jgi:hypothetical protein